MLSILSIVYLVLLAGCAVAVLLTAIMFLIKKKANKSLTVYALCVAALLGLGFLASRDNPVPSPRYPEPEPVVVSPGSQHPAAPWPIARQPEPEPAESEPAGIPEAPAPEPEPEPAAEPAGEVPAESAARTAPVSTKSSRSAAAPVSAEPAPAQAAQPEPVAAPISTEPTLMDEPEFAPMSNPTLMDDPTSSSSSGPQLADE